MISLAIWCKKEVNFQRLQIALSLQACAILLSLKNLLVLINNKLHSKSCYYLKIKITFFLFTHCLSSNNSEYKRRLLVAGSVGPYGACQHDWSEYSGNYVDNMTIKVIKTRVIYDGSL